MTQPTPTLHTLAAWQQHMALLPAGTELRCERGLLGVRLAGAGAVFSLPAGQALCIADTQQVLIDTTEASRFRLVAPAAPSPAAPKKNRQGLAAWAARIWRSGANAA